MNLPEKAHDTCVAQIAEALFGQPGMSLMEMANRRGEIEALVKDAGRYRWLRDSHESRRWEVTNTYAAGRGNPFSYRNSTLDKAIDAAMKEQAE